MSRFDDVVAASREVTETSSRSQKIATLADLIRRLEPAEVGVAAGFLTGVPRQGRVGVGYRTVYGIEPEPAAEPTLTIEEVDRALADVERATGAGSAAERRRR